MANQRRFDWGEYERLSECGNPVLVVTRSGEPVSQLMKFDGVSDPNVVYGVVGSSIYDWTVYGLFNHRSQEESILDIFFAEESL